MSNSFSSDSSIWGCKMNSDFFRLDLAGLDLWMNRGSSLIKSSSLCFFLSVLKSLQSRMSCSRKHSLRVKTEKRLIKGVEGSERQPVESKDERDIYGWGASFYIYWSILLLRVCKGESGGLYRKSAAASKIWN